VSILHDIRELLGLLPAMPKLCVGCRAERYGTCLWANTDDISEEYVELTRNIRECSLLNQVPASGRWNYDDSEVTT